MGELLDIYDENLVKIGSKERADVHRDGDWHKTFHCWVIFRDADDGRDYMVLQKRRPDKDVFPDKLDISAAGHYAAGETMIDGVREVREELGIDITFEDLIHVGGRFTVHREDGIRDYQFNDVFMLIHDAPLSSYDYQRDEISGLIQVDIDDALALFAKECDSIPAAAVGLGKDVINIRRDDFIVQADNYVYRALVLAKQCLNGEKHLVI